MTSVLRLYNCSFCYLTSIVQFTTSTLTVLHYAHSVILSCLLVVVSCIFHNQKMKLFLFLLISLVLINISYTEPRSAFVQKRGVFKRGLATGFRYGWRYKSMFGRGGVDGQASFRREEGGNRRRL
ncbi:uncharacterized protein LOC128171749 [Crassostrea angulata]|uniref:uncharacterized protein LOC128171749 n=1 Tax=Magallana angulata TaxID=2784310 RepID=UPI0022B1E917|nr:uncharacterized protein LOC128171749 [Crassostrea angulata]